jgi:hypothetical protein
MQIEDSFFTTCKEGFSNPQNRYTTKLRFFGCPKNLLNFSMAWSSLTFRAGSRRLMSDGTKIYAFGLAWLEIWPVSREWLPMGQRRHFIMLYGRTAGRPRPRLCVQWDAQDPFPIRHRKECVHLDCMSCLMCKLVDCLFIRFYCAFIVTIRCAYASRWWHVPFWQFCHFSLFSKLPWWWCSPRFPSLLLSCFYSLHQHFPLIQDLKSIDAFGP